MSRYRVLILTDHRSHTAENSLYDIAVKLCNHPLTDYVDIASRAASSNCRFFSGMHSADLWATRAGPDFVYSSSNHPLSSHDHRVETSKYDLIWLRLPPPLDKQFLDFLSARFSKQVVINRPAGLQVTGSKEFLLDFMDLCPPMKICRTWRDVIDFADQFPIVLKPFRAYGGRGLIRIDGNVVWSNEGTYSLDEFIGMQGSDSVEYLAVKYLRNVMEGDKRIIVVNGEILGASLRLPADDSWICNVSMGGTSIPALVADEEYKIVNEITPVLLDMGIVMYGMDTLVNDAGRRVLSELNTTSIGGLAQIGSYSQKPIVEQAIDLIFSYCEEHKHRS